MMNDAVKSDDMAEEIEIKVLKFPANVRRRPGMYVGNNDQPAKILGEVADNGMDEILGGYASVVNIATKENRCYVVDNGRGVPIKINEEGITAAISVWGSLHSSSKFDDSDVSIGMNGVGSSCSNALSDRFIGFVNLSKKDIGTMLPELQKASKELENPVYRVEFNKGELASESIVDYSAVIEQAGGEVVIPDDFGTFVYFEPDSEMWQSVVVKYDMTNLTVARMTMSDSVTLTFNGEEIEPYCLKKDFNKTPFIDEKVFRVEFDASEGEVKASGEILFGYSGGDFDYRWNGSVNTLRSPDGVHIQRVQRGIGQYLASLVPGLNPSDAKHGLRLFSLVFTNKALFNSQTKEHCKAIEGLSNSAIADSVERALLECKDKSLKKFMRAVGERVIEFKRMQGSMSIRNLVLSQIKTSDEKGSRGMGTKVKDCSTRDRTEAELFIVEGDSAAGSLLQSRNTKIHALLPLRGKPINGQHADIEDLMENEEFKSMLNVIGAGMTGVNCDPSKSRYGKIIFMADEDADGSNILAILLGNAGKFMRELVEAGMFYIAMMPLYKQGDTFFFAGQGEEQGFDRSKPFSRFKGLGEMNPEVIAPFAFGETRRLVRITPEGLDGAINLAATTSAKRELMYRHGIVVEE